VSSSPSSSISIEGEKEGKDVTRPLFFFFCTPYHKKRKGGKKVLSAPGNHKNILRKKGKITKSHS